MVDLNRRNLYKRGRGPSSLGGFRQDLLLSDG